MFRLLLFEFWLTCIFRNVSVLGEDSQQENCCDAKEPSLAYEESRRAVKRHLKDLWRLLDANLEQGSELKMEVRERYLQMMSEMEMMERNDGYDQWREKESEVVSKLVQAKTDAIQNPDSCSEVKYFACDFHKNCGVGCVLHNLHYCLVTALASGRVLHVTDDKEWEYNRVGRKRFTDFFQEISQKCSPDPSWGTGLSARTSARVTRLPDMDRAEKVADFLPVKVPIQLLERLRKLHGNPPIWWAGQVAKYLLRLTPYMQDIVERKKSSLGFRGPVVGVHIRRSDKLLSKFKHQQVKMYPIEDYMKIVEEYFDLRDLTANATLKRTVFVATDDKSAILEMWQKYTPRGYVILGDLEVAGRAGPEERYIDPRAVEEVLADALLLSQCEFLVCTLSSNTCRLAFELMQARGGGPVDASDRCHSLDFDWRFAFGNERQQIAVLNHTPRNGRESELRVGDIFWLNRNLQNGLTEGMNFRTWRSGTYPSYKVKDYFEPTIMENFTFP